MKSIIRLLIMLGLRFGPEILRRINQGTNEKSGRSGKDASGLRRADAEADTPGRTGSSATIEVNPERLGAVIMRYAPLSNFEPDPGEIVWTWVPYEENNGQGKDRPVLVIAPYAPGQVLAIQLTSKTHPGETEFVELGSGDWDGQGRESWALLGRVFRVSVEGMRREAAQLDKKRFVRIAKALSARYGWTLRL